MYPVYHVALARLTSPQNLLDAQLGDVINFLAFLFAKTTALVRSIDTILLLKPLLILKSFGSHS